ncbi:energy transducer TonB [Tenacibaculum sp. 190524A02b]|uniref:Periplasmic protein TonB n=1 Tax=Tenacibaculum vairaonense TaxID=3137860 RepID=A0ABM9PN72_9FLAO
MNKILSLIVIMIFSVCNITAQEVCATPEEDALDLNSITKCTIKPSKNGKDKKTRQITVKVSASRRFLKKRAAKKQAVSGVGSLSTSGVSSIATSSEVKSDIKEAKVASSSKINKNKDFKDNIASLKAKLSKEEVRKASRFSTVDKIPAFSKCISAKKDERIDCFNEEMVSHIQKHFRYPGEAVRDQIEGEVWVRFIIDKNGYVRNIKTLGPDNGEILNEEARRVVTKLPHFKPARKEGKPVSVKYGFPINFSLEE